MRAIVIGAGAIGASVACRLALGGAAVTVLDAGRAGGGTSGASFAWTNSHGKSPLAYHALNLAGIRAHAALKEEFGASPWWHGTGCIEWAAPDRQAAQRAKVEQLRNSDYAAEWIDAATVAELEPDIDRAALGEAPIAFFPEEGWVDLVPYVQAMLAIGKRHGLRLRQQVRVTALLRRGGRIHGVRATSGEVLEADVVVNCAGRWSDALEPAPGAALPLAPTCGFMLFTPPVATSLQRVVRAPGCNLRPDGGGRVMLRRSELDSLVTADTEPRVDTPEALDLIRRATEVLPAICNVTAEAARIGVRPIPKDGLPAVGPLPQLDGYYVVVTHSGATLAPILGRLTAREILGGGASSELEAFRPARFLPSAKAEA